jgi:hypothetical protein
MKSNITVRIQTIYFATVWQHRGVLFYFLEVYCIFFPFSISEPNFEHRLRRGVEGRGSNIGMNVAIVCPLFYLRIEKKRGIATGH